MSGFSAKAPPAVAAATPSDPSTTTSTTGVMMGLGSSCTITPTTSRVLVFINGDYFNSANTNSVSLTLKYGTGAAPTNGAAVTGTTAGAVTIGNVGAINIGTIFTRTALITGLTPGTAYWFDIYLAVFTAGTVGLNSLTFGAHDV